MGGVSGVSEPAEQAGKRREQTNSEEMSMLSGWAGLINTCITCARERQPIKLYTDKDLAMIIIIIATRSIYIILPKNFYK